MTIQDWETELRSRTPGEFASLSITFNEHAFNYINVAQAIEQDYFDHADWVSDWEKKLAAEKNSVWIVQWYPNTPIGFNALAASSLEAVLLAMRSCPK